MYKYKMDMCYPIREIIYQSNNYCNHEWKPVTEIGTDGTYGEIWAACCKDNCNYVMKYMPYDNGARRNKREDIINEIITHNKCSEHGLCPVIYDSWLCDTGGVYVMELYKMTVLQLLLKFKSISDRQKVLANIITLTDKLHRYGIYHGDLHLDNIMVVNRTDNSETLNNYEYYFIDFGKGGNFISMNDPHIKDDYIEISSHIQDLIHEYPGENFEELYETMKIYMKKFD